MFKYLLFLLLWLTPALAQSPATQAGGRLTIAASTPVLEYTVSGANTLYYAPYIGAYIPIYNGTSISYQQFTSSYNETVGLKLGTFGSGWSATAVYDVFVTMNGSLPVLCTGPAWTSNGQAGSPRGTPGVRATTGSLGPVYGVMANSTASMVYRIKENATITVPQYQATWVGTILTNASGTLDWIYGGVAWGGSPSYFSVWNTYNRVVVASVNFDSGIPYTYTQAVCRLARNSGGNQIFFVTGNTDDPVSIWTQTFSQTATIGAYTFTGSGINTTATSNICFFATSLNPAQSTAGVFLPIASYYVGRGSQIGVNAVERFEYGDGSNAVSQDVFAQDTLNFAFPM